MKRILITGSEGALGFYLKRALLLRNKPFSNEIFCLSRNVPNSIPKTGLTHIQANFLDHTEMSKMLMDVKPDLIFHLAWETKHGSYWHDEVNKDWTESTIRFAREFAQNGGQYFGFAGTCAEYSWGEELLDECTNPYQPATLYGQEKLKTTNELLTLGEKHRTTFNSGRLFFPFSSNENPNRITSLLIQTLLEDKPLHLRSGDVYRSICHTRHIADCFIEMAQKSTAGVFNVVPGHNTHLGTFLKRIATKLGKEHLLSWDKLTDGNIASSEPKFLVGSTGLVAPYWPEQKTSDTDIEDFVTASVARFS